MDPSIYLRRWHKLRDRRVDPAALHQLSRQVAFSFVDRFFQKGVYEPAYIALLCEMATFYARPDLDGIASSALFELIVEKLCDDFEELPIEIYSHVMCQVITYCRGVPAGKTLDETLAGFGIFSFDHLHQRAVSTHTRQYVYHPKTAPERIILLSRVTLGADVAILSVMIQRLRKLYPKADILIIGNRKLHGLFGGDPNVRLSELHYARRGGLFERFSSWHATLQILRDELPQSGEERVLVIDPDSRISQLGVLPILHTDSYLFFNTRNHTQLGAGRCVAELTNDWMNTVFGAPDFCYPRLWPVPEKMTAARARTDLLRASGTRQVITMNFGVGQNPRKRVSPEFEKRLLRTLAAIPGSVVILDQGFGADEVDRTRALARHIRSGGLPCVEARFATDSFPPMSHGVVAVQCDIGEMAALIAHSDEYIGYDSACQHIAAATRTPTLTVFAGSNNMNFVRRWSACGDTECRIVHVNTLTDPQHVDLDEIIARIMQERTNRGPGSPPQRVREIRRKGRRGATAQKSGRP